MQIAFKNQIYVYLYKRRRIIIMRKVKNLLIVLLLLTVTVAFFKITSARDEKILAGLKKENDKKEYCLKNEGNKELDDECRVIIREARGE